MKKLELITSKADVQNLINNFIIWKRTYYWDWTWQSIFEICIKYPQVH